MQQQDYPQLNEFGLGSLVSDFFDNVADTVKGVAKAVAPIAPFVLPFLPGGQLLKLGIGAGIGALAGQKPADIAKNLALQTATSGIGGILGSTKGQGTIGQRFMSGVTGKALPQVTSVPTTDQSFLSRVGQKLTSAFSPEERAINPEFKKAQLLGKLSGIDLSEEDLMGLGIPKESSFMYQYGPLAYAGLTALPLAEQLLGPKEEEEDTGGYEDLYTPNYAQYQLLDITGPQGYDPTIYAAMGGEITGFASGSGQRIEHPDGKVREHPKRIGEIAGPGTGTSDDIPAMLSDGEFVMTAKAVRNAGNGSRKEGAKNMYKMMKNLENGGSLSQQSIGMA